MADDRTEDVVDAVRGQSPSLVDAADLRDGAAERRDRAAEHRDAVAQARTSIDLATAARDRWQSEVDRLHAARDREAAVSDRAALAAPHLAGRFLVRRSKNAREQAQRNVEASARTIASLVAVVTSLADQMDTMPSAGLDHDRDRRARVHALRRAAESGTRTLEGLARDANPCAARQVERRRP